MTQRFCSDPSAPLLQAGALSVSFGAVAAVQQVSFSFWAGETLGLAGANGAGKTTLFNLLTGFTKQDTGTLTCFGKKMPRSTAGFVRFGLARTFQNLRLFPAFTVKEQLEASWTACKKAGPPPELLLRGTPLSALSETQTEQLTYGQKKLCELLRCVATGAALIFLDEPAAGMNTAEKTALSRLLQLLRDTYRLHFFIIEHDLAFLSSFCSRILVMDTGRLLCTGTPAAVFADPAVRRSFLGG